jgi:hypothetical protein
VSRETIYTAIYAHARGELRRDLIACLRQGKSTRMPRRRGTDRRGQIPDMVSIHVRPPEVDDRVMPQYCSVRQESCTIPGMATPRREAAWRERRRSWVPGPG